MNINKTILLVAVSFSFLVNIPRFIFSFVEIEDKGMLNLFEVSLGDTVFRTAMLFAFCYLVLKYNLQWVQIFNVRYRIVASITGVITIFFAWMGLFELINTYIYSIYEYSINPKINRFIYVFFVIMLLVLSRAIKLNRQTKIDAIEKEQLTKQNAQNELNALKNQVNPHFLFNSLNTLSLLVREDQKAAGKFINKLSFLYRYILQSKDQDMLTVKEELKFLESYIYLIKERYRDNFKVNIHINQTLLQRKIPALTLQLLMENVVKHNEISNDRPLYVDVFDENYHLVVKNKLQRRTGPVESTHTGLSNLNGRFKLHMDKELKISKDNAHFIVKIPVA